MAQTVRQQTVKTTIKGEITFSNVWEILALENVLDNLIHNGGKDLRNNVTSLNIEMLQRLISLIESLSGNKFLTATLKGIIE